MIAAARAKTLVMITNFPWTAPLYRMSYDRKPNTVFSGFREMQ
jgi:hypothetical protein